MESEDIVTKILSTGEILEPKKLDKYQIKNGLRFNLSRFIYCLVCQTPIRVLNSSIFLSCFAFVVLPNVCTSAMLCPAISEYCINLHLSPLALNSYSCVLFVPSSFPLNTKVFLRLSSGDVFRV